MAACLRSVRHLSSRELLGFHIKGRLPNVRILSNAVNVDLGKKSGRENVNLFDCYFKRSIKEEQNVIKTEIKDLTTRMEKERLKTISKYTETELKQGVWTENSRRAGLVGKKLGMTQLWRKDGRPVRVTLVQVKDNQVLDSRVGVGDGGSNHHTEIIVGGYNEENLDVLSEGDFGQYVSHNVTPKKKLRGFPVTKDALMPSGTQLYAAHFVPGQYVRVVGISKKLGFQGVMKRWGMKGQPRSHGQTKTHRKMGATGGGGTPGRIFPGKKMAGHTGGNKVSLRSVKLYRINNKFNVLFISGQIPGADGDFVKIQDSMSKKQKFSSPPPFPTYIPDPENPLPEDTYAGEIHPYTDGSFTFKGDES